MKERRSRQGKEEVLMKSENEGSGTHVAETAPPLFFFPPAVLCNSSLKISGKRRRRSINKHKGWRGEERRGRREDGGKKCRERSTN